MHGRTFVATLVAVAGLTVIAPDATATYGAARQSTTQRAQAGWTSANWSGYAIARTRYASVSATWKVPTVKSPPNRDAFSLTWIGIDGFNNSKLIQVGTEQDFYKGRAYYRAFWEILPAAETVISTITVHPGDAMSASIVNTSGSRWTITINDVTTHQSFTTAQTYNGPGASAEWIHEAPYLGSRQTQLAATTLVTFNNATANHANPKLALANRGRMVRGGNAIATPSAPSSDTDGFTVAYGSSAPAPPPP